MLYIRHNKTLKKKKTLAAKGNERIEYMFP